jgi:hypothetical protein
MASNIVPGNIDGTYPKAGQDNSSQGMRDNFNSIKNNFTEAKTEIDDLQTNKANLNAASDFADNEVTRAVFKDTAQKVFAHGTKNGEVTLDGSITLSFSNLPASGNLGKIILDVTCTNVSHTITIPTSVLVADNVTGGDGSSNTITLPDTKRFLYEFLTPDGGTTILMNQIGKVYI